MTSQTNKLMTSQTNKLMTSQTNKLMNSQTHKLTNSQTHKLTILRYILQNTPRLALHSRKNRDRKACI